MNILQLVEVSDVEEGCLNFMADVSSKRLAHMAKSDSHDKVGSVGSKGDKASDGKCTVN